MSRPMESAPSGDNSNNEEQALFDFLETDVASTVDRSERPSQQNERFTFDPREELAGLWRSGTERVGAAIEGTAERGEEAPKERLRRIGKNALEVTTFSLGMTYLAVEAGKDGVKVAVKKVVAMGKSAVASIKRRRATRRMNKLHAEANTMNEVFDAQGEANDLHRHFDEHNEADSMNQNYAEHAEALDMNRHYDEHNEADSMNQHYNEHAEAESMNQHYDAHSEAESMNKNYAEHAEALEMNEAFDENVRQERAEAQRRAAEARANKLRRRANRREKVRSGIELGKKGMKWIGRKALAAFKASGRGLGRVSRAATAATGGLIKGAVMGAATGAAASAKASWNK